MGGWRAVALIDASVAHLRAVIIEGRRYIGANKLTSFGSKSKL
jgi:hypothetical protein